MKLVTNDFDLGDFDLNQGNRVGHIDLIDGFGSVDQPGLYQDSQGDSVLIVRRRQVDDHIPKTYSGYDLIAYSV